MLGLSLESGMPSLELACLCPASVNAAGIMKPWVTWTWAGEQGRAHSQSPAALAKGATLRAESQCNLRFWEQKVPVTHADMKQDKAGSGSALVR